MRILFTGGGSGGHIFPIIAISRVFDWTQGFHFYYLGLNGFAREQLIKQSAKTAFISAGKIRRYFSLSFPFDLIKTFIGIIQSFWYLFFWMPDVIFSKGGYGSFPVVLVGWIYRIPIILHESDSAPGLANSIMAKFAKKIILSFSGSEKYFAKYKNKIVVIGNPVRNELTQGNKDQAKRFFKIGSNRPVVFILGGSQGAQKINEIVLNTLPRLLEIAEVIHVSGKKNFKYVEKNTKKTASYHLFPFLNAEQMKQAFAAADLVINRAGANSISEISACGKPSILIPLPKSAQDHQKKNAYEFAASSLPSVAGLLRKAGEALAKGGPRAIILEQQNLTSNLFLSTISNLLDKPDKLKQMSQQAKIFYNPKTPELIKAEILKFKPKP